MVQTDLSVPLELPSGELFVETFILVEVFKWKDSPRRPFKEAMPHVKPETRLGVL
jgi:hypothetical protein